MPELLDFVRHDWIVDHPRAPRPLAIEGIMRVGDLVIITGGYDTFKSTLALELAWSLATGHEWLRSSNFPIIQQMRIGLLQAEIDPGAYDARCKRFPRAEELFVASCMDFTFDRMGELDEAISDNSLDGLVLDPLGQLWPARSFSGEPFSENVKTHVSPIMRELKRFHKTFILVHHDPKQRPEGVTNRASGSSALLNDPDVRIFVDRQADNRIKLTIRNRLQKPTPPFFAQFDEGLGRIAVINPDIAKVPLRVRPVRPAARAARPVTNRPPQRYT